ncbi:MAG: hypothetical protein ACREMP_05080 [Candidatus Tyrphobacter sp.]
MRPWRRAAFAVLALSLAAGAAASSGSAAPLLVAAVNSRCNGDVSGTLERHLRTASHERFGDSINALNGRQQELESLLQQAQIESNILNNVCLETELTPIQDQLVGVIAWGYVLESDIASKRYALLHCARTAAKAPSALVASAWYAIATTLQPSNPSDPSTAPSPAPLVREVIPMVRSHAAALRFTLPAPIDATEYWRNTILATVPDCSPPTP